MSSTRFWDRWKPARTSAFSVGLTVRSDILTPSDLDFLVEKFGDGWGHAVPRARRAPTATGSSIHVHLLDRAPEHASSNILLADSVLDGETLSALIAVDPAIRIEVHVKQDLPDVGEIPGVQLTPEAIGLMATSERFAAGLEIDQYGAAGHPVSRWLTSPLHSRRKGYRATQLLLVESAQPNVKAFIASVETPSGWKTAVPSLLDWRLQHPGELTVARIEQTIRLPGEWGIGLHLDHDLITVLAEAGVGLDLQFRTTG